MVRGSFTVSIIIITTTQTYACCSLRFAKNGIWLVVLKEDLQESHPTKKYRHVCLDPLLASFPFCRIMHVALFRGDSSPSVKC